MSTSQIWGENDTLSSETKKLLQAAAGDAQGGPGQGNWFHQSACSASPTIFQQNDINLCLRKPQVLPSFSLPSSVLLCFLPAFLSPSVSVSLCVLFGPFCLWRNFFLITLAVLPREEQKGGGWRWMLGLMYNWWGSGTERGLGGHQALVSQQDSEIAHYHEIYLAFLHLITAGQRELEEDLDRTEKMSHWTHLTIR